MTTLIIGIVIFGGIHVWSILAPHSRDAVKAMLGEGVYKGLYSLLSTVGLAVAIWGFIRARNDGSGVDLVYEPALWTRHAAMLLVLIAFIVLGAAHGKGYLKRWLWQPMSIGIALWAIAHLIANGQRTDVVLFGAILFIAALDIVLSIMRGKVPHHVPQIRSDIIAVVVGVVLYLIFLYGFHPYILGVPIV